MDFVIITGMSGAGKSTVGHILEDMGYLCIDNIPFSLIESCIELYMNNPTNERISFTLDIRGQDDFTPLCETVKALKQRKTCDCKLIYLDASDEVIVARYQESRHLHPLVLTKNLTLTEALKCERQLLSEIREAADFVLDTTRCRPVETKEKLELFLNASGHSGPIVTCMSFGFKHGVPADLDLLFDVRCFPNPFYVPELRYATGLDQPVYDYVFSFEETRQFMDKLYDLIDFLMPKYKAEGKSQLTVGIGCTGGQHRSVAIAETLGTHLKAQAYTVNIVHRDMKRANRS